MNLALHDFSLFNIIPPTLSSVKVNLIIFEKNDQIEALKETNRNELRKPCGQIVHTAKIYSLYNFLLAHHRQHNSRAKLERILKDSLLSQHHILIGAVVEFLKTAFCSSEKLFSKSL